MHAGHLAIPALILASAVAQSPAAALPPDQLGALTEWLREPDSPPPPALAELDAQPLDRSTATELANSVWSAWRQIVRDGALMDPVPTLPPTVEELSARPASERPRMSPHVLRLGDHTMPFHLVRKESSPPEPGRRALFLCMHGGGREATAEGPHTWNVNDREWRTQTMLAAGVYPAEGLFFVPRMADDRLGRWWHAHNQDAIDRVIQVGIAAWGIDPDQVYVLGISEGGYGTDILAPFMPDRFAAADAMAAGVSSHDNPPENLRHLPFRTDIGADDTTYDRIGLARGFHARLDELRESHPGDYRHELAEQEGRGHAIDYRPGVAWLTDKTRDPAPLTVTWTSRVLHGRRRPANYWLGLDAPNHELPIRLTAVIDRDQNSVTVEALADEERPTRTTPDPATRPLGNATLRVMLRDDLLDLDREVVVSVGGTERFRGVPDRRLRHLVRSTALRGDPLLAFPVVVEIDLPAAAAAPGSGTPR